MITCQLMGGLGNQLFQLFATISCAINMKKQFIFLDTDTLGGGQTIIRPTYWTNFLSRLKVFTTKEMPSAIIVKEKEFKFNPFDLLQYQNENICLYGYFQSYKYFFYNFDIIYKMIDIQNIKKSVIEKTNLDNNAISIHFRIGDYKKIQQYHPILTFEYYRNAVSLIQSKDPSIKTILYFCEEEDIKDVNKTINKLKKVFLNYQFIRCEDNICDWEQMILMSCCKHNIIANSSFSWWGAYFNTNPNKIVCYPSVWFGELVRHNTIDLCPNEWNKISISNI